MNSQSTDEDRATELVRKASPVCKKAVDYDKLNQINDAIPKYTEGLAILSVAFRLMDETHKLYKEVVEKRKEYKERLAVLKAQCQSVVTLEQRKIKDRSIGHGYEKIFGPCCDDKLKNIEVDDSYIRNGVQFENFVRFCELVVAQSKRLKTITLNTHSEAKKNQHAFQKLALSLESQGITLNVEFIPTIHDRQITFDNGWTVKIGRGLDYFYPVTDTSVLGAFDLNFRPCKETIIDIMKGTKKP